MGQAFLEASLAIYNEGTISPSVNELINFATVTFVKCVRKKRKARRKVMQQKATQFF